MPVVPVISPIVSPGTEIAEQTRPALEWPPMFKVLLLNDDFTPMDFVVAILEKFFQKDADEATRIMMAVHQNGVGLCGIYPFEIAETKAIQVVEYARQNKHPLQTAIERE